jgi:serralysin
MVLSLQHQGLFTSDALFGRVADFVLQDTNGVFSLYAGLEASANIARFDLDLGLNATLGTPWILPERGTQIRTNDLVIIGTGSDARLLVTGTQTTQIESTALSAINAPAWTGITGGPQSPISQIDHIQVGSHSFIITGSRDASGLNIYEQTAPTVWAHRTEVADHEKAALSDIADLVSITVEGSNYLISGATGDGGLSTFAVNTDGAATLIDTIGVKQGLWLSGLDDLVTVEAAGTDYVTIAATNSSSLSLVRVNPLGVMFVEDHINDDRDSRFANVDAIDSFEVGNRGFVVAGGSDDGVTLLEIMPDGQFFDHGSLANHAGGGLENITALKAAAMDGEVQVFVGSQTGDITQLNIDTSTMADAQLGTAAADTLTGTAADDLLYGGAGNDQLNGGNGDDLLVGGGGTDQMNGGAGADVFVFGIGTHQAQVAARIEDFNVTEDRIDLSDWGRIYHISSLDITSRSDGAELQFGDQVLQVDSHDNSRLDADALSDSFLF